MSYCTIKKTVLFFCMAVAYNTILQSAAARCTKTRRCGLITVLCATATYVYTVVTNQAPTVSTRAVIPAITPRSSIVAPMHPALAPVPAMSMDALSDYSADSSYLDNIGKYKVVLKFKNPQHRGKFLKNIRKKTPNNTHIWKWNRSVNHHRHGLHFYKANFIVDTDDIEQAKANINQTYPDVEVVYMERIENMF